MSSVPDVEPIEHGTIEVGRVVFETLSAALDPYPRKSGATLEWQDPESAEEPAGIGPVRGTEKAQRSGVTPCACQTVARGTRRREKQ